MKKLKIAVISCGGIARKIHLPAIVANPDMELVAVCDTMEQQAKETAQQFGAKMYFTDYKKVLELEEVEAVDICSPNYLHSAIAIEAMKCGKHVLCEKPDAITVDEVIKMKDISEKTGKLLMVMRNNRFRNNSIFLKKYIENGNLGEIYAAKCGWVRRRGIPGKGSWFTNKEMSGGGPLIDLGVHMVDLTIWLMGNPKPVSVVGSTYQKFGKNVDTISTSTYGNVHVDGIVDVEDLAMGFIRFENGQCLAIEFSWATNIEKDNKYLELLGTKAGVKMDASQDSFQIYTDIEGAPMNLSPQVQSSFNQNTDKDGEHARNVKHFTNCILNGEKQIFIPQQGVDMIKIISGLYKSAETGREVLL